MQRLALFRKLEFLAPHKSIEVFLDRSASYFARDEPTQLTAAISWRTPEGARRSTHRPPRPRVYRDLGFIEREVPHCRSRRDNPYAELQLRRRDRRSGLPAASARSRLPAGRDRGDRVPGRSRPEPSAARKLPGRVKYTNVVPQARASPDERSSSSGGNPCATACPRPPERCDRAARRAARTRASAGTCGVPGRRALVTSRLEGLGNEVAIETLELAHEGFETE